MSSEMETDSPNPKKCSNGKNESSLTPKCVTFNRMKDCFTDDINWVNASDVTLIVNNQKLSAHKNVLAINSDYFDKMFTSSFKERDQDNIKINIVDVSFETLKTLIDLFYTSKLVITELNVQDLLIGANILLLEDVRDACVNYLKSMIDAGNCINMKDFANSLGLTDLYSLCLTFIINNFRLVANAEEFMTVSYDEIMIFIQNDNLFAKEEMVYDVVIHWIKHDPATRSKYSTELLWFVRLPLVLNTYQGVIKVHEFQGARINGISSFRMEHRKPFRKGILMLSHYPLKSPPEWYDAALDQWHNCICENCPCKTFQRVLSPPRHLCTCILLDDGRLFAAGGYDYGRGMRLANIFDPLTNEWVSLDDMNYEHIKPYIVQLGLKVFVIGGLNNDKEQFNISHMQYYELKKKKWFTVKTKINIMSEFKTDTFVACVNESIYFIGPSESECYNPKLNSWKSIAQLPEKNEGSAICTLNDNIYVIGGHGTDNFFKSVWTYYTETNEWAPVADLNTPRSQSGVVVMNGCIFVFGGKTRDKSYSNTFEIYNPHDNEWIISNATMNIDRCNIDAIVVEKSCILFKKVFEEATNNIIH